MPFSRRSVSESGIHAIDQLPHTPIASLYTETRRIATQPASEAVIKKRTCTSCKGSHASQIVTSSQNKRSD